MIRTRGVKAYQIGFGNSITRDLPPLEILGKATGKVLVVGWGSTYGTILSAVEELQAQGKAVSAIHLRYLHPWQNELDSVLKCFDKILVPELNLGQLCKLLRAEYLVDAIPFNKTTGKPFLVKEIREKILQLL